MSKKMKRLVVIFLVISALLTLSSCGKKPTDEEIIEAAKPLVTASALINDIFYGDGIPYAVGNIGNGAGTTGNYAPADPLYLEEIGVKSTADLRKMTSKVYSEGVCYIIFSTKLSSVSDGTTYAGYAEYIDLGESGLMVYTKREDYINANVEYLLDTMQVVEKTAATARVSIEVKLSQIDKEQSRLKEFDMIKTEDGAWLLDSMTYIAWDEEAPSAMLGAQ